MTRPRFSRPAAALALAVLCCAPAAQALTVERKVDAAYLREHPREMSVKVVRAENGLLAFTVTRTLTERRYMVARLVVRDRGRVLAESSTPSYAVKDENRFYFSVSADNLGETTFELSESGLGGGARPVPIPGTIINQFQLRELVPQKLLVLTRR
jgi:hypothetical protein